MLCTRNQDLKEIPYPRSNVLPLLTVGWVCEYMCVYLCVCWFVADGTAIWGRVIFICNVYTKWWTARSGRSKRTIDRPPNERSNGKHFLTGMSFGCGSRNYLTPSVSRHGLHPRINVLQRRPRIYIRYYYIFL